MKVVVDTNIIFSALLNRSSRIAQCILFPNSRLSFFAPSMLLEEIVAHEEKLLLISGYSKQELDRLMLILSRRIRFIHIGLIPEATLRAAEKLTKDMDVDDTEFVALAIHMKAKLWSGDKKLRSGLEKKGWNKFLSTEDVFQMIRKHSD